MRRQPIAIAVLAFVGATFVACGGARGAATTASPATTTSGAAAAAGGHSWTAYGGSGARSGVAPGAPAAPSLRRRFARSLDGEVYAQPLIAGGRIYVATENNSVY